MATDSNFTAVGSGNADDVGIVGWGMFGPALFPTPLQIGVWGLGWQHGVFGLIDDGTFAPELGLPTMASDISSSASKPEQSPRAGANVRRSARSCGPRFAALRPVAIGTKQTYRDICRLSAFGGKADMAW
jgi:hypothetical protein